MNLLESARIALRALRANRLRSALTTLGIIIGVAAVIILVALGNGIKAGFNDAFGSLATQITLSPNPGTSLGGSAARDLTDSDIEALRDTTNAPDIVSVTPIVSGPAVLKPDSGGQYRTTVTGTTADYLDVTSRDLVVGRMFDLDEERTKAKVVVLGPNPVAELFAGDAGAALGQEVRVARTSFRVIGVVKSNGQQDDVAIMPLGAARSFLLGGGDEVSTAIVKASSATAVPAALEQLNRILDVRHRIDAPAARERARRP